MNSKEKKRIPHLNLSKITSEAKRKRETINQ